VVIAEELIDFIEPWFVALGVLEWHDIIRWSNDVFDLAEYLGVESVRLEGLVTDALGFIHVILR